ncbi:MAG: hypothetical protein JNG84_03675 [Archangium sp.]|nr:hypothetical protein [Archangium sp.]
MSDVRDDTQHVVTKAITFTRAHPYVAVSAAAATGYVLGGALFSRTSARLLSFAWGLLSLPVVQDRLMELVEGLLGAVQPEEPTKETP